jgi:hypothetical protein
MRSSRSLQLLFVVLLLAALALGAYTLPRLRAGATPAGSGGCQFLSAPGAAPAFCDTFNAPAGTGNRSGDLNGAVWGVSRMTQYENPSQGLNTNWNATTLNLCGTLVHVSAAQENDVRICNGHVAEATNDGGVETVLAMYSKQPFDIAGRTGTVVFDVSNNTQGGHGAWPEFWYTDQPVPAPTHGEAFGQEAPREGFGIRFAKVCTTASGAVGFSIDSAIQSTGYVLADSLFGNAGAPSVQAVGCVSEGSAASNTINHIEIRLAAGAVVVYATDAFPIGGAIPPLKEIATITPGGGALPLSRGVIWIEDAHYNGNKFGTQGTNTFYWDNVGFDGPILPQDRAYDVLDNSQGSTAGNYNLGWNVPSASSQSFTTLPVDQSAISNATGALLTFMFWSDGTGGYTFHVSVNGHVHNVPWPFPTHLWGAVQTLAIPVPVSDLVSGPNRITFMTDSSYALSLANIDLIAVGGGGSPSGSPAPTPTATPGGTPLNNTPCEVTIGGRLVSGTCSGTFLPHP